MQTIFRMFAIPLLLLVAGVTSAGPMTVGQPLPPLDIADGGECIVDGDRAVFRPWQSSAMSGRVQVLEYVAARAGVDKVHRPFYAALKAADYPADKIGITRIVNADDAVFGTGGMVASALKSNRLESPDRDTLVLDADGKGRDHWQLQRNGVAIAILDADGVVRFFRQGGMSDDEVAAGVALIGQLIR